MVSRDRDFNVNKVAQAVPADQAAVDSSIEVLHAQLRLHPGQQLQFNTLLLQHLNKAVVWVSAEVALWALSSPVWPSELALKSVTKPSAQ